MALVLEVLKPTTNLIPTFQLYRVACSVTLSYFLVPKEDLIPCEWCNKGIPPEYLQTHQVKTYDVIVLSYPHIICSYNSVQSYQVKTKHFYHPMLQTYLLLLLLTLLIIMTSLQLGKVCSGSCDVTCFILTLLGTYSVVHCQYCSARIPSDQYHKHLVCCMCNHVIVVLCCVCVCVRARMRV